MEYEYYEDRSLICSFVQNINDECVSQTVVRVVLNNERYKVITCVQSENLIIQLILSRLVVHSSKFQSYHFA